MQLVRYHKALHNASIIFKKVFEKGLGGLERRWLTPYAEERQESMWRGLLRPFHGSTFGLGQPDRLRRQAHRARALGFACAAPLRFATAHFSAITRLPSEELRAFKLLVGRVRRVRRVRLVFVEKGIERSTPTGFAIGIARST